MIFSSSNLVIYFTVLYITCWLNSGFIFDVNRGTPLEPLALHRLRLLDRCRRHDIPRTGSHRSRARAHRLWHSACVCWRQNQRLTGRCGYHPSWRSAVVDGGVASAIDKVDHGRMQGGLLRLNWVGLQQVVFKPGTLHRGHLDLIRIGIRRGRLVQIKGILSSHVFGGRRRCQGLCLDGSFIDLYPTERAYVQTLSIIIVEVNKVLDALVMEHMCIMACKLFDIITWYQIHIANSALASPGHR